VGHNNDTAEREPSLGLGFPIKGNRKQLLPPYLCLHKQIISKMITKEEELGRHLSFKGFAWSISLPCCDVLS
jgi:hypothetical protein